MRRWTIYKRTGEWDDVIEGPDTGGPKVEGVEVIPASYTEEDVERVAKALRADFSDVHANQYPELYFPEAARAALTAFLNHAD